MDIWFLQDMQRLSVERSAIQHLEETANWLEGTHWTWDGGLCIETIIRAHGHAYEVRMIYPAMFPSVPPVVRPRDPIERWSGHQYSDGTLCLEWGPDTWHPDVTGAQVLESAHKLLDIENPLGSGIHETAPSRHRLSPGQTLRGRYGRFYVGKALSDYLAAVPVEAYGLVDFSIQFQSQSFIVFIQRVHPIELPVWEDSSLPSSVRSSEKTGTVKHAVFFKTTLSADLIDEINGVGKLEAVIKQTGFEIAGITGTEGTSIMGLNEPPSGVLLLNSDGDPHFFLLLSKTEDGALRLTPVRSEADGAETRAPTDYQRLSSKSVGIVGVGSAGSKIASSLARAGVSGFYLVDEDVFLPENICRHVLDWLNVGEHKVDAVAEKLSYITPDVKVEVARLNLTGQESTASLSGTINRLAQCDLIVDATADSRVFNLLAGVATAHRRPLVWLEVYSGGIGGMIARSRPGSDPDPQTMRAAYHQFTTTTSMPALHTVGNYTAEEDDGSILSASDADVSIIAYHATRFAIDVLLTQEPSMYPYSMYLIGLTRAWIFKAPFHTIPIATDHLLTTPSSVCVPDTVLSDTAAFLTGLLEQQSRASTTS